MRKRVGAGGVLALVLVMVCAVALALPIENEALKIWQEGETVFFQMDVSGMEDFPEELQLNPKHMQGNILVHKFGVTFYDGNALYDATAMHYTEPDGETKMGTLTDIEQSLMSTGIKGGFLTGLDFVASENLLTWSVTLPVKDRDGNEVSIDWDNITNVGRAAMWFDYSQGYGVQVGEIEAYEVKDDGTLESLGEDFLSRIVFPK